MKNSTLLNTVHYQRNANQNYNKIVPQVNQNGPHQKVYKQMLRRVWRKGNAVVSVGGNANRYSHYRRWYGDSLKN